jgi:hypothetical protein
VLDTASEITDHDADGVYAAPRHITVTPHQADVVEHRYSFNGGNYGSSTTPDFTFTPNYPGDVYLEVWTVNAAGDQSGHAFYYFNLDPTPIITSTDYPPTDAHGGSYAATYTFEVSGD